MMGPRPSRPVDRPAKRWPGARTASRRGPGPSTAVSRRATRGRRSRRRRCASRSCAPVGRSDGDPGRSPRAAERHLSAPATAQPGRRPARSTCRRPVPSSTASVTGRRTGTTAALPVPVRGATGRSRSSPCPDPPRPRPDGWCATPWRWRAVSASTPAQVARTVRSVLLDARGWQREDDVRFVNVSPAQADRGATPCDIRVTLASPALTDRLCHPLQDALAGLLLERHPLGPQPAPVVARRRQLRHGRGPLPRLPGEPRGGARSRARPPVLSRAGPSRPGHGAADALAAGVQAGLPDGRLIRLPSPGPPDPPGAGPAGPGLPVAGPAGALPAASAPPGPDGCPAPDRPTSAQRQQHRPARVDQRERVTVGRRPRRHPSAGRRPGRSARGPRQGADPCAAGDRRAPSGPVVHRLVGRAQAAGVPDADHPSARDDTRERDRAGAGAEHRLADRARQVDAAVPRQPPLGRGVERPAHRGPGRQRPGPGAARCGDAPTAGRRTAAWPRRGQGAGEDGAAAARPRSRCRRPPGREPAAQATTTGGGEAATTAARVRRQQHGRS